MDDITRHPDIAWIGAADLLEASDGIQPTRVPPGVAYQLDVPTNFIASMCSGVRLALRTDATEIEIRAKPLRVQVDDIEPDPARFDLVLNGEATAQSEITAGVTVEIDSTDLEAISVTDNGPAEVNFAELPSQMKSVEVWLPHAAQVTIHHVKVTSGAVVEPPDRRPSWIHYGSSISHCTEADRPTGIWPAVAARANGDRLELTNLGFGGQCHTDQFVARFIRDSEASLISLKLGINSLETFRERTFRSAVHGFLDTIRDRHQTTPVVICSPIYSPDRETPSDYGTVNPLLAENKALEPYLRPLTTQDCRTILANVVEARVRAGDENLYYLDGLELFGPDDIEDLPDGLHPNTAGYIRMGERFAAKVLGDGGLVPTTSLANAILGTDA